MAVSATAAVEVARGGSFLDTLVSADHVVSVYLLKETASSIAFDSAYGRNPGTYSGIRGTQLISVSTAVPEGLLGVQFAGGKVTIPDDGDGFSLPEDASERNLSLAGGAMDIVFLMKTTTNDASIRGIVTKIEAGGSQNGWYVALINGGIRFLLRAGGVQIFSLDRGAVNDGAWHLIHCFYDPALGSNQARIYIDGAQSGAAATATTEPVTNTADCVIGDFDGLVGTAAFTGSVSAVMIGREGSTTLSAALDATLDWTAITDDVLQVPSMKIDYGPSGGGPLDRVCGPASFSCALRNSSNASNGIGTYSPGHANALSGFALGIPIRVSFAYSGTTYYKFQGFINAIEPEAGLRRGRRVQLSASDWIAVAARDVGVSFPIQINQTSGAAIGALLDAGRRSPPFVDLDTTAGDTFPFAGDTRGGERTSILQELARLNISELGYVTQRGGTTGFTLAVEPRSTRQLVITNDATFDESMRGLEAIYDEAILATRTSVIVTPRRIDAAATTVLWTLQQGTSTPLEPGVVLEFDAPFRDPSNPNVSIGGTELVTPVATTDYTMNSAADGSGTNLTSSFSVTAVIPIGSDRVTFQLQNTGTVSGFITKLQIRGKGVYAYESVPFHAGDFGSSIRQFGGYDLNVEMPYQSSLEVGSGAAQWLLAVYNSPLARVGSMVITPARSDTLMTQALVREPGDRIGIVESVTALSETDPVSDAEVGHFIQHTSLEFDQYNLHRCEWELTPAKVGNFWVLGVAGASEMGETTVLGF